PLISRAAGIPGTGRSCSFWRESGLTSGRRSRGRSCRNAADYFGAGLAALVVACNQQIVNVAPEHTANRWCHYRYPPPAVAGAEDIAAPPRDRCKDARAKVARGVDGVTGVEAEAGADQKHERANQDGSRRGMGRKVQAIRKGKDDS